MTAGQALIDSLGDGMDMGAEDSGDDLDLHEIEALCSADEGRFDEGHA